MVNLYAQQLSQHGWNQYIHIYTTNSYVNTVSINVNLYFQWFSQYIRPVATLIQPLEIWTHTPTGSLSTADIGEHAHTPSGYINAILINLAHMLSDNLNTSVINKYTNMLGDDSHTVAIW